MEKRRVVLNFLDGRMMKGYADQFSAKNASVTIVDESSKRHEVDLKELKAVFFVKTFEGDRCRRELKSFAGSSASGKRVLVRFRDGETLMGYVEGGVPWEKSFFLESKKGGFILKPVDSGSNNIEIFVVSTSVEDVTCF
ncbi:MAG: hypothetical protein AB1442_01080 [Nitrospirota bacterium]